MATKVLVNSQATGQAFVAAGGNPKLLNVVYNGFDSGRFDTVAIQDIEQVQKLIEDQHLAQTIAQQGYTTARSNFAWSTILTSFAHAIAFV